MKEKQISVLGCGWLGLPLAKHFITNGFKVKGSTTSKEKIDGLVAHNIDPFVFTLGEESDTTKYAEFLKDSDVVIINFPPRRIPNIETIYKQQLESILPFISDEQHIVFVSSTSVYQNTNDWVTEAIKVAPEKASGHAVLSAENLLFNQFKDRVTVLRFSGLVGPDRLPGRFLANKKDLPNSQGSVNVIHQNDCIRLISEIINQNCWGEIINGCADEHPTREAYYTKAALKIGLEPPTFLKDSKLNFKKVSNEKGKAILDFEYEFPNPMDLLQ